MPAAATSWKAATDFAGVCAAGGAWLRGNLKYSPFSGVSAGLYPETTAPGRLRTLLALHDRRAALTINSQPGCSGNPGCGGEVQKSYVEGFADRRLASRLAALAGPDTTVFVFDFKTQKTSGNYCPPTRAEVRRVAEPWVLTRLARDQPYLDRYNPARPAGTPFSTMLHLGRTLAYSLLRLALHDFRTGVYRGGSPGLASILKAESVYFHVSNTSTRGADASKKVLAAATRP